MPKVIKCRQFRCVRNKKGKCQCETVTLQPDSIPLVSKLICVEAQEKQVCKETIYE